MTENELDDKIAELCELLQLRRYHAERPQRVSLYGWPDLVIWGPSGVLFRELKGDWGRPSLQQIDVLRSLGAAGANARIWRPEHWHNGQIEAELRRIAAWPALTG